MSFRQWVVVEKLFPTERLRRRPQRKRLLAKPKDPMSMPLWKSIQLVIQIKTKTTSAVLAAATTWSCPGIRTERSFYLTALAKFVTLTTVVDTVYQKCQSTRRKVIHSWCPGFKFDVTEMFLQWKPRLQSFLPRAPTWSAHLTISLHLDVKAISVKQ